MNTTRNGKTPDNSRKMPRRGRNNPARQEATPIGEWEADVTAKRNGRTNAAPRRKVKTVGIKQLDAARKKYFEHRARLLAFFAA